MFGNNKIKENRIKDIEHRLAMTIANSHDLNQQFKVLQEYLKIVIDQPYNPYVVKQLKGKKNV